MITPLLITQCAGLFFLLLRKRVPDVHRRAEKAPGKRTQGGSPDQDMQQMDDTLNSLNHEGVISR